MSSSNNPNVDVASLLLVPKHTFFVRFTSIYIYSRVCYAHPQSLTSTPGPGMGMCGRLAIFPRLQDIRTPPLFPQTVRRWYLRHFRMADSPHNRHFVGCKSHIGGYLCQLSGSFWRSTTASLRPRGLFQTAGHLIRGHIPQHMRLVVCQVLIPGLFSKTRTPCKRTKDHVVVHPSNYDCWLGHLCRRHLLSLCNSDPPVRNRWVHCRRTNDLFDLSQRTAANLRPRLQYAGPTVYKLHLTFWQTFWVKLTLFYEKGNA